MTPQWKLPEYSSWKNMPSRCRNPNSPQYRHYGGRGISVCQRWHKFADFYADMGSRPDSGYSLERINNDGNYEPGNCRWATQQEQVSNTRVVVMLEWGGKQYTVSQLAAEIGMNRWALWKRIKHLGMSVDEAVTRPVRRRRAQSIAA